MCAWASVVSSKYSHISSTGVNEGRGMMTQPSPTLWFPGSKLRLSNLVAYLYPPSHLAHPSNVLLVESWKQPRCGRKREKEGQVWLCMSAIPVLKWQRQEDQNSQGCFSYPLISRSSVVTNEKEIPSSQTTFRGIYDFSLTSLHLDTVLLRWVSCRSPGWPQTFDPLDSPSQVLELRARATHTWL